MISGSVKSDEARIRVSIRGQRRREQQVEAVVDTGFTAWLTLPPTVIAAPGLRWQSLERGTLADGSDCLMDVYEGRVIWDGKVRRILIGEADATPLVGMRLLRGFELKLQVRSRGKVIIRKLPAR